MYILLVAATTGEIQPALDWLGETGFRIGKHETEALISGVGSLATTYLLTYNIHHFRPDLVLQAGIGGSFSGKKKGTVLAVKTEILADIGVWEEGRFRTAFDLGLADPEEEPFTNGRLINPYEKLFSLAGLEEATAITVNEVSTDPGRIGWYRNEWSPELESMEGGALHYVCLREGIPFLQLRSVSNEAGDRDKTRWDIPLAITSLNARLMALLNQLEAFDEL
jgi:futalosine hydrolase